MNKSYSCFTESDPVDVLKTAIIEYKNTIQQVEKSKLKNFNKKYQNTLRKNLVLREDFKLHQSQNLIMPSTNTLVLSNFYEFLLKISKLNQVYLNIIPSLFLPKPYTFMFTNSEGSVQINDGPQAFEKFCSVTSKEPLSVPLFILKLATKRAKLFTDIESAKLYIKQHKLSKGILQEFIAPPSDRTSICKVLWKHNKFKYSLIVNKNSFKTRSKKPESLLDSHKKTDESLFYEKLIKKIDEVETEKTFGLLNRVLSKVPSPWKQGTSSKLYLTDDKKFVLETGSLNNCQVNEIATSYPEIEQMMQTTLQFIKKFLLYDRVDVQEIVCEFIKDSQKAWRVLSVPLLKVQNVQCSEIFHMKSVHYALRAESDSDPVEDTSIRNEERSEMDLIPVDHNTTIKSQTSLKSTNSFEDKFQKTIKRIDRIRKRDKINANVGLQYELIQNYKNKMNIGANGDITAIMVGNSNDKLLSSNGFIQPTKRDFSLLHSCSNQYDKYNASKMQAKYTDLSVESFESIIKEVRRKVFKTVKLDEKYGGKKFLITFNETLVKKIAGTCLAKFLKTDSSNETVFCPGISLIFDCKVNLALAKLLHVKHANLYLTKEDFDLFSEQFLVSVKEFEFTQKDFEYLSGLLQKLSRDIYMLKSEYS